MQKKRKIIKKKKSSNNLTKGILIGALLVLGFLLVKNSFLFNKKIVNSYQKPYYCAVNSCPYSAYSMDKVPVPTQAPLTGYCLKVPVLTYHHIQPQKDAVFKKQSSLSVDSNIFDGQMAYLTANGYTSIFANELINALINHSALPEKPIVITMDDGYVDNYTYALPILQKYNIKANLMLTTGLVGSNSDMLTWSQIQDIKNSGRFYFTNHTWSHQSVTRASKNKIETEIDMAASQLKQYAGQDSNIFTYPYGELNNNAIQILQNKGYVGAFSTIPGFYQCDSFIMTLHRTRVGNSSLSAYGI